jgi:hypothetical protein
MKRKYLLVFPITFLAIILIWLFLPYFSVLRNVKQKAIDTCIWLCKGPKLGRPISTEEWNRGLCLSNNLGDYDKNLVSWVCDVAHSPREAIDNQPENQCSAYREGKATHFVEVDLNCNLIRAV